MYELFLDSEFFYFDLLSLSCWRTVIDRLITYDPTIFKDLMQKIVVSQSGAINIFANREQVRSGDVLLSLAHEKKVSRYISPVQSFLCDTYELLVLKKSILT